MSEEAKKEIKRLVKVAYRTGGTVPFSLSLLIELGFSLKVIRTVIR